MRLCIIRLLVPRISLISKTLAVFEIAAATWWVDNLDRVDIDPDLAPFWRFSSAHLVWCGSKLGRLLQLGGGLVDSVAHNSLFIASFTQLCRLALLLSRRDGHSHGICRLFDRAAQSGLPRSPALSTLYHFSRRLLGLHNAIVLVKFFDGDIGQLVIVSTHRDWVVDRSSLIKSMIVTLCVHFSFQAHQA